jgi:Zn ribbon nucleic-acid-binding protein
MAQIFHYSSNTFARMTIYGAIFAIAFVGWAGYQLDISHWDTRQLQPREQPIPFSHAHHVGGEGFDCRYCHTSVENSSFAGIPATQICMNCHSQIWRTSPTLEPVRASYRTNESISWTRVHDLPDYVYFNHSIHVAKGVGCESCHGRVDKMPLMWKENTLQMEWCLNCHRHPERYVRPKEFITTMGYVPAGDQEEIGRRLIEEYHIQDARLLTSCSTCHR